MMTETASVASAAKRLGDHPAMVLEPGPLVRDAPVEVSIVMPCLNEAETLASCIATAQQALLQHNVRGEVIVADNGSSDGSPEIAGRMGARFILAEARGYGHALRSGIEAARGRYVIVGDADDSYDFSAIEPFVENLRGGCDLVMGNRFRGRIMPGAMPWMHRWIGNPVLTGLGRLFFRCPAGDFHCGLRGFSKAAYERMELQTTGMEFASEMVIKSTLLGLKIAEVPVVLYRDGRSRPPHLRSWRDGWRHLRFMLLFSPLWLFLIPGLLLLLVGLIGGTCLLAGPRTVGRFGLDIHTLLVAGFACLLGCQLVIFAAFTKAFAIAEGLHPPNRRLDRWLRCCRLEVGVLAGSLAAAAVLGLLIAALWQWGEVEFGALDPRSSMRQVIPGVVLMTLGVQTVFASFFLSVLTMKRKPRRVEQQERARE